MLYPLIYNIIFNNTICIQQYIYIYKHTSGQYALLVTPRNPRLFIFIKIVKPKDDLELIREIL